MSSITRMETILKTVLGEQANQIAREVGFMVRQRKLTGADFVQALVFGWLHAPDARIEQLARALLRRNVQISSSGLSQRFTQQAVQLMQRVLQELVKETITGPASPVEVLGRFRSVIIEDSSVISLPDELAEQWPGCGGGGKQSRAGLKLHVRWDLLTGELSGPIVTSARTADQRSPLRDQPIEPGQLYVTDEGYFGLQWLKEQTQAGQRYFLTRPRSTTAIFTSTGSRLNLLQIGPTQVNGFLDLPVQLGHQVRLPARLLMIRVPDEVVQQRQERLRETARRHSRVPTQEQLALTQWTILITNAPLDLLSSEDVVVIQRARWQIERLFRLWKEHGLIDEWRSKQPQRIMCEIFGKLMALVIQQWVLAAHIWHDPYRSFIKAAAVVRDHALDFLDALMGTVSFQWVLSRLARELTHVCRVEKRSKNPCLAQLFLQGGPWPFTGP